jgi:ATP-dependent Lon protease
MKESAQAALTYTRARAETLGLPSMFHETNDIHVHLPSASIPKDGPSAGVTMAIAMMSALSGRPVRRDVAMTGELTLRGRVLPVGGIKEKVLAAHRAGIHTIVLPRRNLRDLDDVTPDIRAQLSFAPVESMDEVIAVALHDSGQSGDVLAAPTSGALTRGAVRPSRPLSDPLPASGRVARPRARRDAVVTA